MIEKYTYSSEKVLDFKPELSLTQFMTNYSLVMEEIGKNIEAVSSIDTIKSLIKYYQGKNEVNPIAHIEKRWFEALDRGEIDYSVYADEMYFMEVWACWNIYSRKYLKLMEKNMNMFKNISSILDLGNGIGYTTCALTELFPKAKIIGTNLKVSDQWTFNEVLQKRYDFELTEEYKFPVDMAIASEYFEHIERPIEHLESIVQVNKPKYLVLANSFGTIGIGHFKTYKVKEELVDCKKIKNVFRDKLLELGYKKIKTGFWNNTPSAWEYVG